MRKKIVFLPYDMDTAIGINNEGALVFSYNLEDIDQTAGGADVFNGQQSVLWKNMRAAFFDEMKAMYQTLRSTGALLDEPVTYDDAVYTHDTSEYRLAKFKAEAGDYMELQSAMFYYLFTELFLMVDSRAKNMFPSFMGGEATV